MFNKNFRQWLDSNRGLESTDPRNLESEATAIPTEPHHCPSQDYLYSLQFIQWSQESYFNILLITYLLYVPILLEPRAILGEMIAYIFSFWINW